MKKFFESLSWLFLLALLVPMFATTPKKKKWFTWKRACIGLCLVLLVWQIVDSCRTPKPSDNNCVPATYSRIFPTYTEAEMNRICKWQPEGTQLKDMLAAWNVLTTNKLVKLYDSLSIVDPDMVVQDLAITFDRPYLWMGTYTTNFHCALVWFTPTNVMFSHSQLEPGTTNYYVTPMDYTNFFEKTYRVYTAPELNERIRFR
jgi:hypothetical protein